MNIEDIQSRVEALISDAVITLTDRELRKLTVLVRELSEDFEVDSDEIREEFVKFAGEAIDEWEELIDELVNLVDDVITDNLSNFEDE
jgi:hypothetical protein